jgi:alanine racemase
VPKDAEVAEGILRPAWAEIDLDALAANVELLREVCAPAALCAVVKADGYGHGAVAVAKAAIEAGATSLAVALVDEGIELREAGIAAPILVLSEPPIDAAEAALEHALTSALYSDDLLAAFERAALALGGRATVHVKVDTGMHRVGLAPEAVVDFVSALDRSPNLTMEGFFTHLAVADGDRAEDREFTGLQISRFEQHLRDIGAHGIRPALRHAANSAGAIAYPASRFDLARVGIALYGEPPSPFVGAALAAATGGRALQPVLSLRARVVALRRFEAGERPSYGRRRPLPASSWVATVPIGYADGVVRRLFESGGEVLIGGRRRPLAGVVTMDQTVVDCGPEGDVSVGDEVVLIGRQGDQSITAAEWAERLGTVAYEVLTGIGPRVPRVVDDLARAERRRGLAAVKP